jgi:hypothetical protein
LRWNWWDGSGQTLAYADVGAANDLPHVERWPATRAGRGLIDNVTDALVLSVENGVELVKPSIAMKRHELPRRWCALGAREVHLELTSRALWGS